MPMGSRRSEGAALLVAAHGALGGSALDASAVHTLGQIGEALLATGAIWQIRRLTAAAGERYAADRATLKHQLDELAHEPVRVVVLAILGTIIDVGGAPALVTGSGAAEYPEDSTLPLAWIRDRLAAARAEQVVVVVSAHGAGDPRSWLGALATGRAQQVIAVEAQPPAGGCPLIDGLLTGLCGEALDPRTGTVTMASLSRHLARHAPSSARQESDVSETLAQPPPLAGLWDVRRSQLANRPPRPDQSRGPEDLTGVVLPGRFRIDKLVARGTFGTVYRARQLAIERDIAVKVLHANIDPSSEDGQLFVHEIRSVGRIDHANVVRIHQADITHDGRLFFAMELLDGTDLQQLVGATPLPRERAVELVRQLLVGLGAAHDAGLVHADVKPANAIVLPRDGSERVVLVDFGLARLRSPGQAATSAGGTPAFMAPEQLHEGRVDARSDLYSAALVLVFLLTGWRRPNAMTLSPSLATIDDPALRAVLERALAVAPGDRYQTARELAAALTGSKTTIAPVTMPTPLLPFRHLAPLTESDRGRLHGRERDLAVLTEHVLYRRSVIYTAPSGTGKTSLLRAGLVPRLEALGVHPIYLRCRADSTAALAAKIWPGATTIADAITSWDQHKGGKLVLVLDQLESALIEAAAGTDLVDDVLAFDRWPADADVAVVLSIREDYLARLMARSQAIEPGIPLVRLPPLGLDGARAAIAGPLAESRLAIDPDLLDVLLGDLQRAAAAIEPEMGWGTTAAVYPPHLQLACSVLYEALGSGATLTLAHYRKLGGFDAIVGEHLERVLDTELPEGRNVIARDLFVALVTTAHQRAVRPESELVAIVGAQHGAEQVTAVLEVLRSRGLLVRVRDPGGEPGWELVHDSLVPRVLAWLDRRDLARRLAIEVVRYHVRRSRPETPSLLSRAELRELKPHADAVAELEAEWQKRGTTAEEAWSPARLIAHSRRSLRRRTAIATTVVCALLAIAGAGVYRSHVEEARVREQESLRARDLGRFVLSLEPFDWDPTTQRATPVTTEAMPTLRWDLHAPDPGDPDQPGPTLGADLVVRGLPRLEGSALVEHVEARGAPGFLVVSRGDCAPSIVPLRHLPGYARRDLEPPVFHIRVPTCEASVVDTIEIPEGRFIYGGPGEPPSNDILKYPDLIKEQILTLPTFRMDRTEVTNAAFGVFASMSGMTDVAAPSYPSSADIGAAGDPRKPVSGIDWTEARAFCRFLGKQLPSSEQWTRALRGGERLADGTPNPMPRRNFPWGTAAATIAAKLAGVGSPGAADVGSFPLDRSPESILDLAGNVTEWTSTASDTTRIRVVRGGNWFESTLGELANFMAIENPRATVERFFGTGLRCISNMH